jgi:hypothetical protein
MSFFATWRIVPGMSIDSPALSRKVAAINPEWALAGLALFTFVLIPIHINTIYSGLPAHPLFLHVPVILIPVAALGALVLLARPALFARHGLWLGLVTVAALGATNLTIGAGKALRNDLHLQGFSLITQHEHAADTLRIVLIIFTALLLIAVATFRTAGPRVTGVGALDGALAAIRSGGALGTTLRVLVGVFGLLSLYYCFRTGDLGAKAVWQGRISGGGFPSGITGGASGGGASSLFGTGGGG